MVDLTDWHQEVGPDFYPGATICGTLINRQLRISQGDREFRLKRPAGRQKEKFIQTLLLFQEERCAICQDSINDPYVCPYELDHIIPLRCSNDNRINSIHNLQLLCRNCHGIKTIFCDPVIHQVMYHLVEIQISRVLVEQEIHCFQRLPK